MTAYFLPFQNKRTSLIDPPASQRGFDQIRYTNLLSPPLPSMNRKERYYTVDHGGKARNRSAVRISYSITKTEYVKDASRVVKTKGETVATDD